MYTPSAPQITADEAAWPPLPLNEWADTCDTLHMWTQIIGKVRMALSPHVNHWWEAPLYVSARGLTTSPIPYGYRAFEIEFDFLNHNLEFRVSDGAVKAIPLYPRTVADFYRETMSVLRALHVEVKIRPRPDEVPDPIPFATDEKHASYDPEYVSRFHTILLRSDTILKQFRSDFLGKVSPVHFFWGSFDLAVTRFSGRRAPERQGADAVTRDAYSHECSSVGWWPGGGGVDGPAYYSYTSPEPPGFPSASVRPAAAHYHPSLKEFILMYDEVRKAADPRSALLDFCQSTYEAGAALGHWDRTELERSNAAAGKPS